MIILGTARFDAIAVVSWRRHGSGVSGGGVSGALVGVVSVGGGVGRRPRHGGFRLTKMKCLQAPVQTRMKKNNTFSEGFSEASKKSTLMLPRA